MNSLKFALCKFDSTHCSIAQRFLTFKKTNNSTLLFVIQRCHTKNSSLSSILRRSKNLVIQSLLILSMSKHYQNKIY
jgi:hypothetical protein